MKQYARWKNLEEVKAACLEAGFEIDTEKYDHGADWVTITGTFAGQDCTIIYSDFNGHFIGKLANGEMISERTTYLDNTEWYTAIMDFLFVPAQAA